MTEEVGFVIFGANFIVGAEDALIVLWDFIGGRYLVGKIFEKL